MTKEETKLVIKDICGRLPYGLFVDENIEKMDKEPVIYMYDYHPCIDRCKPYLRPMESMTEKEKQELFQLMGNGTDIQKVDFYNRHLLDYRGLIPMGLALEALDGMYNIENM